MEVGLCLALPAGLSALTAGRRLREPLAPGYQFRGRTAAVPENGAMRLGFDSKWCWAAVFVGLSLLDLCLTWSLVEYSYGCAYEANPAAAWILNEFGWFGVAVFKLVCTATVVFLGIWISRRRARLGGVLFAAASAILLFVTGYSFSLWTSPVWASDDFENLRQLHDQSESLEQQRRDVQVYSRTAEGLARELLAGRVSLADATRALAERLTSLSYDPLRYLRARYEGLSDEACLSASLIRSVASILYDLPDHGHAKIDRLALEFQARFDVPLPTFARFETHGARRPVETSRNSQN
jgi:hypothetical protein